MRPSLGFASIHSHNPQPNPPKKKQKHTHSPRPELDPARYFPPSSLHEPLPPSAPSPLVLGVEEAGGRLTPLELAARLRGVYCQGKEDGLTHT